MQNKNTTKTKSYVEHRFGCRLGFLAVGGDKGRTLSFVLLVLQYDVVDTHRLSICPGRKEKVGIILDHCNIIQQNSHNLI